MLCKLERVLQTCKPAEPAPDRHPYADGRYSKVVRLLASQLRDFRSDVKRSDAQYVGCVANAVSSLCRHLI